MFTKVLIEFQWRFIDVQVWMRFNNMLMQDEFMLQRHYGKYLNSHFTSYIPLLKDYKPTCQIIIKCGSISIKESQMY